MDNPDDLWMSVVFDSEESYQKNADSSGMDAQFKKMREHLREDPEWHDGHVLHEAMRKG